MQNQLQNRASVFHHHHQSSFPEDTSATGLIIWGMQEDLRKDFLIGFIVWILPVAVHITSSEGRNVPK